MTGPGGARGKVLAVGLLAAVLLAGYSAIVEPIWRDMVATRESIDSSRGLIERYRALAAAKPALEAQLAELESRTDDRADTLSAPSDTLAGAALQNQLRALFERVGAVQRSLQALPPVAQDDLVRITVRAQFTAEMPALQVILYELETQRPFLFVDNLDIRRKTSRRRRTQDELADQAAGPLDVRLDLSGYMRPAAG